MGIMLQDSFIFSGTIRDNIAYGKLDATDDEIRTACSIVGIDNYIESLPDGYNTVVNERGSGLFPGGTFPGSEAAYSVCKNDSFRPEDTCA